MRIQAVKAIVIGLAVLGASACAERSCWGADGLFGFCVPDTPESVCLLEYNSALVEGDPCCFYEGGRNTCDRTIACNERSGGSCCQIYDVEGSACCQYAGDKDVDDPARCETLLNMSR